MKQRQQTIKCSIRYRLIETAVAAAAVTELISRKQNPSIIGGNDAQSNSNRFSAWVFAPTDTFEFTADKTDPLGKLQAALSQYSLDKSSPNPLPESMFPCGWIGYFSYELGRYIESIPETTIDDLKLPLIRLCFYDRAICHDRTENKWYLIALEMSDDTTDVECKLDELAGIITQAEKTAVHTSSACNMSDLDTSNIDCNITKQYYETALAKTRQYIYDGDVYQINFSQRFRCDYNTDPVKLYHWQNMHNPSPYAAYIDAGDFAIVSASPELFLRIENGKITTKPIKGTRPRVARGKDAESINRNNYTDLVESEKDQAELYMIIDLERNDITRVCEYGTIKVIQPRTIEAYPTVFHAVATIQGRLRNEQSPQTFCDILRATFPGGSITGAPKIRAMEIIDELETTARSVYTGAIGFIGIDLNACLNIAIRTVIIKDNSAFVQTGGGIVADSDTQAEWDETITKARALLTGIKAVVSS